MLYCRDIASFRRRCTNKLSDLEGCRGAFPLSPEAHINANPHPFMAKCRVCKYCKMRRVILGVPLAAS